MKFHRCCKIFFPIDIRHEPDSHEVSYEQLLRIFPPHLHHAYLSAVGKKKNPKKSPLKALSVVLNPLSTSPRGHTGEINPNPLLKMLSAHIQTQPPTAAECQDVTNCDVRSCRWKIV